MIPAPELEHRMRRVERSMRDHFIDRQIFEEALPVLPRAEAVCDTANQFLTEQYMRRSIQLRGCRMNCEAPHQERSSNDTRPKYVCGLSDTHIRTIRDSGCPVSQLLVTLFV
jgi:hypothetical protein